MSTALSHFLVAFLCTVWFATIVTLDVCRIGARRDGQPFGPVLLHGPGLLMLPCAFGASLILMQAVLAPIDTRVLPEFLLLLLWALAAIGIGDALLTLSRSIAGACWAAHTALQTLHARRTTTNHH